MKALAWEDEKGQTRIACNSAKWIKERHNLTDDRPIKTITNVIDRVCSAAKHEGS